MNINDPLPKPQSCDVCGSPRIMCVWAAHEQRNKYMCLSCRATVYCHKGTEIPLGYLADDITRSLRSEVHLIFDKLWLHYGISRDDAYAWLAETLRISSSEAHIGRLSDQQLRDIIPEVHRFRKKLKLRTQKKRKRERARDKRQHTRTVLRKQQKKYFRINR